MGNKYLDWSIYTAVLTLLTLWAFIQWPGIMLGAYCLLMLILVIREYRKSRDVHAMVPGRDY